jgi:hypothetical protein
MKGETTMTLPINATLLRDAVEHGRAGMTLGSRIRAHFAAMPEAVLQGLVCEALHTNEAVTLAVQQLLQTLIEHCLARYAVPADQVTLLYTDEETGQELTQPLTDVSAVGTLSDPDTDQEPALIGIRIASPTGHRPVAADDVVLVYRDDEANTLYQPLADLQESGILLDEYSGRDCELEGTLVLPATSGFPEPEEVWANPVVRELAAALADRGDRESAAAARWLADHESDDIVWDQIGPLLDTLTELATKDYP